jgi:hypothetical protein
LAPLWREDGSITVEAVIMLPVLILFYITSFTFFDAYRTQAVITRTGYVVGDLLSRQPTIDAADVVGMRDLFAFMTFNAGPSEIRVTEVAGGATLADPLAVVWSEGTGTLDPLTEDEVAAIRDTIPDLAPNERITIVETRVEYRPPFFVGLPAYTMQEVVVTRPRYDERICFVRADGSDVCAAGT